MTRRGAMMMGLGWIAALAAIIGLGVLFNRYQNAAPQPTLHHVEYANLHAMRNRFDLYLPDGANKRPPLIVWIHGGAWREGNKDHPIYLRRFLKEGFAVASINYRLSQDAIWPAQLEDVGAAIRMLRSNAERLGFDGNRVALFGASAGGHLAASAGLAYAFDPQGRVQAVVDWYGPTDLAEMGADMAAYGKVSKLGPNGVATSPESLLIGAEVAKSKDKAIAASPTGFVSGLKVPPPPFLIMHGDADDYVAPAQSLRLHKALTDKFGKGASDYVLIHGGTHGKGAFLKPAVEDRVVLFLKATLALR
jgi:acetyl esterase/lipase